MYGWMGLIGIYPSSREFYFPCALIRGCGKGKGVKARPDFSSRGITGKVSCLNPPCTAFQQAVAARIVRHGRPVLRASSLTLSPISNPLQSDSIHQFQGIVHSTNITTRVYAIAENIVKTSYSLAEPVLGYGAPVIQRADGLANKGLVDTPFVLSC